MKFLPTGTIQNYERFSHEILKSIDTNLYQVRHIQLDFTQNEVSFGLITFRSMIKKPAKMIWYN